ncbi:unnamed protein product [Rotaria magnacalcarata]|uniref:Abasic site processing protein HMCES n=5 Tax=Rotaria magnacalcarata TaxID=392030 RepID=A0A819KL42_9BILA|nr:unnamed protein product [Rotaria magnacalcarata]CAF4014013.1 unnamed protein product [Rotaria magnacalcarata]
MINWTTSTDECTLLPRDPILPTRSMEVISGEDSSFVIDEVSNIIKDTIERIIGGNSYQHNKVNRWTADIVDHVLTELTKLGKPFKYIVQAVIMQKNGAGLHTASSCYWDNTTDGSCTVRTLRNMCGRFACGLAPDVVRRLSTYMNSQTKELTLPPFIDLMSSTKPFQSSWNISPTSTCLCLISAKHLDETEDSATRVLCSMRWSMVPNYHKGSLHEYKPILNNCRVETIDEKPTFKVPLRNGKRCVILAEGFFEWKKNVVKTPYFIYDSEPLIHEKHYPNINTDQIIEKIEKENPGKLPLLAMAGIFDVNRYCESDPLYSCSVCTVDASEKMLNVHIRMPAILTTQQEIDQWLDFGRYDTEKVLPLLLPHNNIQMYRVMPSVGSTKTNDVNNIRPFTQDQIAKVNTPIRNTLDSFVVKQEPREYFQELKVRKEENTTPKKTSIKRPQGNIEDYMFKNSKSSGKRFKK